MDFKFNSSIFKNSKEDLERIHKDRYDPNKNYPNYTGTLNIPKSELVSLVQYLHWALRTEGLKYDNYIKDTVVPLRVSGWIKTSERSGKKFLSLQYTPDYKTKVASMDAKEAHEIAEHQKSNDGQQDLDAAAASLAQGTAGTVAEETQEDFF